jgi:hypothetical protein
MACTSHETKQELTDVLVVRSSAVCRPGSLRRRRHERRSCACSQPVACTGAKPRARTSGSTGTGTRAFAGTCANSITGSSPCTWAGTRALASARSFDCADA